MLPKKILAALAGTLCVFGCAAHDENFQQKMNPQNATTAPAREKIVIEKQGAFAVGGNTVRRAGTYDNRKFSGWGTPDERGQIRHDDHAVVEFQIPEGARKFPLVFVHGYGQSGLCWQTTPDGRDGFTSLLLRKNYATYVVDLPGRGRAARTSAETHLKPLADENFWFDIFRIGEWPDFNPNVQFPQTEAALNQFFRQMTPDVGAGSPESDAAALGKLFDEIGDGILVTHSAGGFPGWKTAIANPHVRAVVSYEPGTFVFPEGDVPEPMPSLTGTLRGVGVPAEDFLKLTRIPVVIYFGDYIPEERGEKLGGENWRVRLQMARKFVDAVNRRGGNAMLVELPKIGVRGNTHFLMSDLNNREIADLLADWLEKENLD